MRNQWNEFAQLIGSASRDVRSREPGSRVVIPRLGKVLTGYNTFIRANTLALETGILGPAQFILTPSRLSPNAATGLAAEWISPISPLFALDFDGVNEDVTCGNVLAYEYNQPQSWEFWLKVDVLTSGRRFIAKTQISPRILYEVAYWEGNLQWSLFRIAPAEYIAIRRPFTTVGAWVHIIAAYDGSNNIIGLNLFINNVSGWNFHSNNPILGSIITPAPLTFASMNGVATTYPDCKIGLIRNYNRNLVQADSNTLWNGGTGIYGADPLGDGSCKGSWPFCTGSGNALFDISGNNYHGTLRNMEPGDWVIGKVPCPAPGLGYTITWTEPAGLPAGCKVRIWVMSYDAGIHKQHIASVDIGIEQYILTNVRVAHGKTVPSLSVPGHYLVQADIIDPNGNPSPPSNTVELTVT